MSKYTKGNPSPYAWKKGVSGNPTAMGKAAADVIHAAREHTVAAINRLVAMMQQDDDRNVALAAANALLDRGHGRPPQAIPAQVHASWSRRRDQTEGRRTRSVGSDAVGSWTCSIAVAVLGLPTSCEAPVERDEFAGSAVATRVRSVE